MSVTFPAWKNPISKDLYFLDMKEWIHSSSPSFRKFNIQCIQNLTVHELDVRVSVHHSTIHTEKSNKIQQLLKFIICRLNTAQHVSDVLTPVIRSSTIAVAASGFTFGAW